MATSISSTNFLSFLLPKSPPPPKTQLPFSTTSSISHRKSLSPSNVKFLSLAAGGSQEPELAVTLYPGLAYSDTLYFSSGYNVELVVDENEPEERLVSRFRREVMKAGIIQECKRRRFYENKQEEKKRKSREAAKRNRRSRSSSRSASQGKQEESTDSTKDEDDEDNWELPEGDIPY